MTPEELSAIEQRAAAATPGPWAASAWAEGERGRICTTDKQYVLVEATDGQWCAQDSQNIEFMAEARSDIALLLAELHRLTELKANQFDLITSQRVELERLRSTMNEQTEAIARQSDAVDELREENARMKTEKQSLIDLLGGCSPNEKSVVDLAAELMRLRNGLDSLVARWWREDEESAAHGCADEIVALIVDSKGVDVA